MLVSIAQLELLEEEADRIAALERLAWAPKMARNGYEDLVDAYVWTRMRLID
ncbi:MAG: hypothetical protein OEN01_06040 [Candidatus Krumholzibacteria bacterium]|nr:hypothetical protein [Candidatus Krumholzibacteria bacterium]